MTVTVHIDDIGKRGGTREIRYESSHPMGKKSRTPSVEARIVGTIQQFRKSKERLSFYSTYIPFTRFLSFFSFSSISSCSVVF